jgi:Uma2 family endonuclease
MSGLPAKKTRYYTWDDYRKLPDEGRYEIIDGVLYDMSAAPNLRHQDVALNLTALLHAFFKGTSCRLYIAPTDVKLADDTVVQPDLLVVCDAAKLRVTHIEGAPDLAIEVLSPSNYMHDRIRKLHRYARAGVKELWIADPAGTVEVYWLDGRTYRLVSALTAEETLKSTLFPDLSVDLRDVFGGPGEQKVVREPRPRYRPRRKKAARR